MSGKAQLHYGGVPVPYTVSWTGEEDTDHIARCPYSKGPAVSQLQARGEGKPRFGSPHFDRQREAIADGLCDLCGKTLRNKTKVSLSHAAVQSHGAEGPAVLQVEPLLHRECAQISMQYCPSLQKDIAAGRLKVRQVLRYRVQYAAIKREKVQEMTGQSCLAVGHAKVELQDWITRDAEWLNG